MLYLKLPLISPGARFSKGESSKGSKELRQGQTLGVLFTVVPVKRWS